MEDYQDPNQNYEHDYWDCQPALVSNPLKEVKIEDLEREFEKASTGLFNGKRIFECKIKKTDFKDNRETLMQVQLILK